MRIDDDFMAEVGLAEMPESEKQAFMEHAEEELEVRVGQSIGMELSDEQMNEFEGIDDDNQALDWLERNVPSYRDVVARVYEAFKKELLAERKAILA